MSEKYLRCFPFFMNRGAGKACLLITFFPLSVHGVSPWYETSGERTEVTSGYSTDQPGEYALYVSGADSDLVVNSPLTFYSEAASVALAENKGTLTLDGASLQNNAESNPIIKISSAYLNLNNSNLSASHGGAYGVAASSDSEVKINNTTMTFNGTKSYGVELRNNSTLIADGLKVILNGKSVSAGVILNGENAVANVTNSTFHINGASVSYGIQQNLGELVADGVTIIATGMGGGVRIGDWGPPTRTRISNSYIQVENDYALLVRNSHSEFNNLNVTATGDNVRALDINQNADVIANGGSYTTFGEYADAVWLPEKNTRLVINDASLTTFGNSARALNALSGIVTVTGTQLTTSGSDSEGLYTQREVNGNNLTIKTTGSNSAGVVGSAGGQVTLANSTIETTGESANGIKVFSGSEVTASGVKVTTHGDNASALFTQAGSLIMDNSTLHSTGNAPALVVRGSAPTLVNQVQLDNVKLTGAVREAIRVEAAPLKITASNGTVLQGGNQQLLTVLTATDKEGAVVSASHVEVEAQNKTILNGNVEVEADSHASVILRDKSQLTGAAHNADIAVYSASLWQITDSSRLQNLVNEGTVAFQRGSVNDRLVIDGNYSGNNGTLIFNTVLGDDRAATNQLIVNGNTTGSSWVEVLNAGGAGAKTLNGIKLIEVQGASDGEFVQKGRIVAGAYEYQLRRGAGAAAADWYLTSEIMPDEDTAADNNTAPPVKPGRSVLRPEAGGYIANSAAAATLFNLSLYDRLGNRSQLDSDRLRQTSLWLRQTGGHNRAYIADTLEAQSNRYSVQLGGDLLQLQDENGRLHIGPMVGYGRQATNIRSTVTRHTTDSAVSGYSIGAYASWFATQANDSGLWLDSWLQYNWFSSSVTGEGLRTENYHTQGVSASLESGYIWKALERQGDNQRRYGFYLQPHAQVIFNGLKTVRLVEQNGTQVITNKNSNLISRIGIRGWITESKQPGESALQPYVELNWLYNSDPYRVNLNQVDVEQNSGRHLAELKTGVEGKVNDHFQLHGSIALQKGRYHYQDASLMLGGKYHF